MYTVNDIKQLPEGKQEMIQNYINKFIESRWWESKKENEIEKKYTYEQCLAFYIVQEYIDSVVRLSVPVSENKITKETMNVGCGGYNG